MDTYEAITYSLYTSTTDLSYKNGIYICPYTCHIELAGTINGSYSTGIPFGGRHTRFTTTHQVVK